MASNPHDSLCAFPRLYRYGLFYELAPFTRDVDVLGVTARGCVVTAEVYLGAVSGNVSTADAKTCGGVVCSCDCDPIAYAPQGYFRRVD